MFKIPKKINKPIYLDYAAATPVDPEVLKAMSPYWSKNFANPSSLYKQGAQAATAIQHARKTIAETINASGSEIIFTAGGTESINLAILGIAGKFIQLKQNLKNKKLHIISTQIEHHAVLNCLEFLKKQNFDITLVPVNKEGVIKHEDIKQAMRPETILVSVMYANNEIGTIEPIHEISKILKFENDLRQKKGQEKIYFHTDACQAMGFLDSDVQKLGVDLLSANGSKIYGPKQTGFLFIKHGTNLQPLIHGGGQEFGLRSGTENVPGIIGLAKALTLATKQKNKETARLQILQKFLIQEIMKINKVSLNGPSSHIYNNELKRLPNNINITISDVEGEALILYLDSFNISASTGSACSTNLNEPSHVLKSIGQSSKQAQESIRITLGKYTTKKDIIYLIKVLNYLIPKLRKTINF